jgi:hypothetical protein
VIPVFFFSNLFEWWIHKYVMHRLVDVWALRAIYDRHTRQHHQYFTDNEMTVSSTREVADHLLSVARALHVHGLRRALRACARRGARPNAGYILMVTIVGQYLIYESFHYCCHVRDNWFRAPHALHQHDPAPPHCAPQLRDHDGAQPEPHVPDRGLGHGYERPGSGPARYDLQRL